jgi:hypothetical protein
MKSFGCDFNQFFSNLSVDLGFYNYVVSDFLHYAIVSYHRYIKSWEKIKFNQFLSIVIFNRKFY